MYTSETFLSVAKNSWFSQETVSLWCEWYKFLRNQTGSRFLARRILTWALEPSRADLLQAGNVIISHARYLDRFWIPRERVRRHTGVKWGEPLLLEFLPLEEEEEEVALPSARKKLKF